MGIKEDTVREKIKMETNKSCMHFYISLCIHTIDSSRCWSFFFIHSVLFVGTEQLKNCTLTLGCLQHAHTANRRCHSTTIRSRRNKDVEKTKWRTTECTERKIAPVYIDVVTHWLFAWLSHTEILWNRAHTPISPQLELRHRNVHNHHPSPSSFCFGISSALSFATVYMITCDYM